jgi:hypothetical protein
MVMSFAVLFAACSATKDKQKELEGVAKDWCLTIRASQVMPVYPLTQDIQPGDVFLVQLPINEQHKQWKKHGYLPLDNHLARLDPAGYGDFYDHSFPIKAQAGQEPGESLPLKFLSKKWDEAPRAAFPTYSFSVKKGGGLNLALPISGVPVGLGLLGADAAEGSVSIGKARTLGIDIVSLDQQLRAWVDDSKHPENRAFLAGLASTKTRKNYVRVVTRIYLTGELDVSLRDSSQHSEGLDAGVPSPVSTLVPKLAQTTAETPQIAADNYKDGIDKLNEMLKAGQDGTSTDAAGKPVVGGSLRLTSATARAISMKETFDPPLVLGYLGFDCQIGPGGSLGPAVPTYALVSGTLGGEALVAGTPVAQAYMSSFWQSSYEIAKRPPREDAEAARVVAQCDALGALVPATWVAWELQPDGALHESSRAPKQNAKHDYELFSEWRGSLDTSAGDLATALGKLPIKFVRDNGAAVEVKKDSPEVAELQSRLDAVRAQLASELIETPHARARRELADWIFANLYATKSK